MAKRKTCSMENGDSVFDYNFNILHEEVSSVDLFEYKTHEKISDSLVRLIDSSTKGITIGIEGAWGSGKSTVINFLEKKLNQNTNQKTLFFKFDAWAHDGDPLRKIFLESLILAIETTPGHVNKDKLTEINAEITGRKKTVHVTTRKQVSSLGKWISFSALLIPFGTTLLKGVDFNALAWPWQPNTGPNLWFVFGFCFVAAPLWVLLLWCFLGTKDKHNKRRWDLFESESSEDYTQDITEDGERTSVEFERFFSKIMDLSLGDGNYFDRAFIVVDNLDRVAPEHAKVIWATLQTFFQHRSSSENPQQKKWADALWFIIPFDRKGLSRIWESNESQSGTPNPDISLANSFLNKCFQVTVEVPSPVMSAWAAYLRESAEQALVGWPESGRNKVIETYQRYASRLDKSPTPRQIHGIVNQVGMLGLRWGEEMSPESICLYALSREDDHTSNLRTILLAGKLPGEYQKSDALLLKSELSGMLFGVAKEKGMELLLVPEIEHAIKSGNGEKLRKLREEHDEAFWIAWNSELMTMPTCSPGDDKARMNFTSAIHGGFIDCSQRVTPEITWLCDIWKTSSEKWDFKTHQDGYNKSMAEIIDLLGERKDKAAFLIWLQKKMETYCPKKMDHVTIESRAHVIQDLLKLLGDNGYFLEKTSLTVDAWASWCFALPEDCLEFFSFIEPKESVVSEIANKMSKENVRFNDGLIVLSKTLQMYPSPVCLDAVLQDALSKAFLAADEDKLSDKGFAAVSPYLKFNKTDSGSLMTKLCQWLDEKRVARVEWFLAQSFAPQSAPLEGIRSRVKELLINDAPIWLEIGEKLNRALGLGIALHSDDEAVDLDTSERPIP